MGTGRGEKVVGGRRRGGGWRVPTRPAGTSALTPPLRGGPASRPHPCTLGYGLGPGGGGGVQWANVALEQAFAFTYPAALACVCASRCFCAWTE